MTYREFYKWCNERAHTGTWGYREAIMCMEVIRIMNRTPFFKRKKLWKKLENKVVTKIVNPTNERIREVYGDSMLKK